VIFLTCRLKFILGNFKGLIPYYQSFNPYQKMANTKDLGRSIIDFDPEQPHLDFADLGFSLFTGSPSDLLPTAVPWPSGKVPTPEPLSPPPAPGDDLSRFAGYDAVVVTWTSAEAAALAALYTPGYPVSSWYEYRHDVEKYIPLVTGHKAPFNDTNPKYARYYHSMGLYFPCIIGKAKVLLFKSGLHFCYDGPKFPVKTLMEEIYATVKPKVFITTGTGGAIGADVLLGDVVIAPHVKFNCIDQYKDVDFRKDEYPTSALPAGVLPAITNNLVSVNAARIAGARAIPKMWNDAPAFIVTTDKFAFDDSTDHDQLQGLGRACDMGDAMVAWALEPNMADVQFFAVRNASDPQIPNPDNDMKEAGDRSSAIYKKYGALTSAASLVATWSIITTIIA